METNNDDTRGKIRIVGPKEAAEYSFSRLAQDITVQVASQQSIPNNDSSDSGSPTARTSTEETGDDSGSGRQPLDVVHWGWGLAPALLTVIGIAVGAVLGYDVFVPGSSQFGALVYVVLVPYYLVGVAGTVWVYRELKAQRGPAPWRANPWVYIVASAVLMEIYFVATFSPAGYTTTEIVGYYLGRFFVNLPIASVVAGPVYLVDSYFFLDDQPRAIASQ